ncbi:MAG: hypothetical protein ACRDGU_02125 [Actinomycetota bacterium]
MTTEETRTESPALVLFSGLLLTGALVFGLLFLMARSTYDSWGAMLIVPVLIALTIPALRRQAAAEKDPRLFAILMAALLLKLAGAMVRHYVAFDIYQGDADAGDYHTFGVDFHEQFRSGNFETGLPSLTSTHFIEFFTAIVYAIIGPTRLGGFLFYSWLGFWGLLFFYRAFVIAVPQGHRTRYARLLFFLPSLWYWPSSIGKEAWMTLTLGLVALGAAHVLSGRTIRGVSFAATGLWLAAIVRPHFAGIMAVALLAGYLFRRLPKELGTVAPIVKGTAIAILGVVALIFVNRADDYLQERGIQTDRGVTTALSQTTERTAQGGSAFVPSILDSPGRAPVAVATVLFRPLLVEAHNSQSLAAALEVTFLLFLSLVRWRSFFSALQTMREQPYLAFSIAYTGMMILALSSIANFGILARQRIQLLPVFLVLLCLKPPIAREPDAANTT